MECIFYTHCTWWEIENGYKSQWILGEIKQSLSRNVVDITKTWLLNVEEWWMKRGFGYYQ